MLSSSNAGTALCPVSVEEDRGDDAASTGSCATVRVNGRVDGRLISLDSRCFLAEFSASTSRKTGAPVVCASQSSPSDWSGAVVTVFSSDDWFAEDLAAHAGVSLWRRLLAFSHRAVDAGAVAVFFASTSQESDDIADLHTLDDVIR